MKEDGKRSRILWVLPKWPFPTCDGARVASVHLLRGLGELGLNIDLLAVAGEDEVCNIEEAKEKCGVGSCSVVRRKRIGLSFSMNGVLACVRSFCSCPLLPVNVAPFASRSVREGMRKIIRQGPIRDGNWDTVVYDGLHSAAHSSKGGIFRRGNEKQRIIYRAHNAEGNLLGRKGDRTWNPIVRAGLRIQTALLKRFESSLVRKADAVLAVSKVDLEILRSGMPGVNGDVVPIGFDFGGQVTPSGGGQRILFVGRMDWPPNRDGLEWFLEQVWPEAIRLRPSLELWIAGSGDSHWLNEKGLDGRVRLLGQVKEVDDLYGSCLIAIVPIFYGSGTRVKAIEASRFARACLSTGIGVEGIGLEAGKTFVRAESRREWIDALVNISREEWIAIGRRAYDFVKAEFSYEQCARRFVNQLGKMGQT